MNKEKPFCLSEKIMEQELEDCDGMIIVPNIEGKFEIAKVSVIMTNDVRESIKQLKERLSSSNIYTKQEYFDIIDEVFGEALTG